MLALPVMGYAQEAVLTGTVSDSTGGVLPGVTVTAVREATGNRFDSQQVQELPVDGRNWMALALLAPGSRTSSTNVTSVLPDRNGGEVREYQTNLDDMQVTNSLGGGGQPPFSREMIAEFQFISNRFDATQGRSQDVQVNVITKSGTNNTRRSNGGWKLPPTGSSVNAKFHEVAIVGPTLAGSL
jgi:hypothetical protein